MNKLAYFPAIYNLSWNWPNQDLTLADLRKVPPCNDGMSEEDLDEMWDLFSALLSLPFKQMIQISQQYHYLAPWQIASLISIWKDEQKEFRELYHGNLNKPDTVMFLIGRRTIRWLLFLDRYALNDSWKNKLIVPFFSSFETSRLPLQWMNAYLRCESFRQGLLEEMLTLGLEQYVFVVQHYLEQEGIQGFCAGESLSFDL